MASSFASGGSLKFRNLLVVVKQTAYEEYSQLRLRGKAPKALRWKRLESRYKAHVQCVNDLLGTLRRHNVQFSTVNRVELDRQHLRDVDLVIAVGGDGTVLSAAHFLDHGTIPLLGVNSDPIKAEEKNVKTKSDERRSHGALCMCTANDMQDAIPIVLYGGAHLSSRTRIQTTVKSTFSETRLAPALNDLLISNPSPAAVSRFRMGKLLKLNVDDTRGPLRDGGGSGVKSMNGNTNGSAALQDSAHYKLYGTAVRFGDTAYDVTDSFNVWSSGMWVSTSTGSSAAMAAAGGDIMDIDSTDLQYLVREHMIEANSGMIAKEAGHGILHENDQLYLRWNSQRGTVFVDGSHMTHDLLLGDEIVINSHAPPLQLFMKERGDDGYDNVSGLSNVGRRSELGSFAEP